MGVRGSQIKSSKLYNESRYMYIYTAANPCESFYSANTLYCAVNIEKTVKMHSELFVFTLTRICCLWNECTNYFLGKLFD